MSRRKPSLGEAHVQELVRVHEEMGEKFYQLFMKGALDHAMISANISEEIISEFDASDVAGLLKIASMYEWDLLQQPFQGGPLHAMVALLRLGPVIQTAAVADALVTRLSNTVLDSGDYITEILSQVLERIIAYVGAPAGASLLAYLNSPRAASGKDSWIATSMATTALANVISQTMDTELARSAKKATMTLLATLAKRYAKMPGDRELSMHLEYLVEFVSDVLGPYVRNREDMALLRSLYDRGGPFEPKPPNFPTDTHWFELLIAAGIQPHPCDPIIVRAAATADPKSELARSAKLVGTMWRSGHGQGKPEPTPGKYPGERGWTAPAHWEPARRCAYATCGLSRVVKDISPAADREESAAVLAMLALMNRDPEDFDRRYRYSLRPFRIPRRDHRQGPAPVWRMRVRAALQRPVPRAG